MDRRMVRRITLGLTAGLVILGCGAPALVTPSPSSAPVSLGTLIVQTGVAAQTQTAIVASSTPTLTLVPSPTKTPTITPTPTATVQFFLATNAALSTGLFAGQTEVGIFAQQTEAASENGNAGNDGDGDGFVKPTATPSEWACRVLSKYPPRDAVFPAGSTFVAVWTVQNTGTKTWPKKGVDVVFQSGARINNGKPYYDIPAGVGPGGTVRISVPMEIPKFPKEYGMRWSLMVGKTMFCSVQFVFEAR